MSSKNKKTKNGTSVVILCSWDEYANGIKPAELEKYYIARGYGVNVVNTRNICRRGSSGIAHKLPLFSLATMYLFILEAISIFGEVSNPRIAKITRSLTITQTIRIRGRIVAKILRALPPIDITICENNFDQAFVLLPNNSRTCVLDLPAPLAEELYYGDSLSTSAFDRLRKLEQETYQTADKLAFHWHTYQEYVRKTKYDGDNFFNLTYGTQKKAVSARYNAQPKIVLMGYLEGYWVNLPLLAKLCQLYPQLDVYGGPEPPAHLGINYKGYAPSKDILADYQFGLITISDDELRKHSFSSKHLEYISYGLPVLAPAWRKDSLLDGSTIPFTEKNFLKQVRVYSDRKSWNKIHKDALASADALSWEAALQELDSL